MIASQPQSETSQVQHSLSQRALLSWTAILTVVGWLLLQLWRSHYFLTDDNLTWHLPLDIAAARRLWSGGNVFWEPNLYDGFDLRGNPAAIALWNPFALLVSPLALTPLKFWIIDARVGLQMVASSVTFAALLARWRELYNPQLSDKRLIFLTISFVFCSYNLIVVASWHDYIALSLSAPLALWGLWNANRKIGFIAIIYAVAHGLLAGHPGPWSYFLVGFSVLTIVQSLIERDAEKARRWFIAMPLGIVATLPFLIPALSTFAQLPRAAAQATGEASWLAMPWKALLFSPFAGSLSALAAQPFRIFYLAPQHAYALASSLAGGLILLSLFAKRRWSGLQITLGVLLFVAFLLAIRPPWLAQIIAHLPIFRSLRWPFKEVFWIVLGLHLLAALRSQPLPKLWQRAVVMGGATIWAGSMLSAAAPSFNPMNADREFLFSGRAETYWRNKKSDPNFVTPFVPVAPRNLIREKVRQNVLFSRLGAYNYPALFEVKSASGYKVGGFDWNLAQKLAGAEPSGTIAPAQVAPLHRARPDIGFVYLQPQSPNSAN